MMTTQMAKQTLLMIELLRSKRKRSADDTLLMSQPTKKPRPLSKLRQARANRPLPSRKEDRQLLLHSEAMMSSDEGEMDDT